MKQLLLALLSIMYLSNSFAQGRYEYKNKGYFNLSKISYHKVTSLDEDYLENGADNLVITYPTNQIHGVSLQSINGWFLGPFISVGVGIGYDYYNEQKLSVFPLFFDLRIYFASNVNSFFLYGDMGSILGSTQTYYIKSTIFTAGLGYKFAIDKHIFESSIGIDGKTFAKKGYPAPNQIHAFSVGSTIVSIGYLF